jgi:hypothetical protein
MWIALPTPAEKLLQPFQGRGALLPAWRGRLGFGAAAYRRGYGACLFIQELLLLLENDRLDAWTTSGAIDSTEDTRPATCWPPADSAPA